MSVNYSFGLPNKQNYTEFVQLEGFLNDQEIEVIKGLWKAELVERAGLLGDSGPVEDHSIRRSNLVFLTPNEQFRWLWDRLAQAAVENNNYRFQFELNGFHEELQLAKYDQEDHFDWHMDFGVGPISVRKLSLSVQLSDSTEYEGGDLQFMSNNKVVPASRKKGTLIIFPSFVMHRVTPITSGSRMSIVGWVSGLPYR